jgi:hypothetical protein
VLSKIARRLSNVHEVAISSAIAGAFVVLAATGLAEIRHWGILALERATSIVPPEQSTIRLFSIFFIRKLHIDIANHMISHVFTHLNIFNFTKTLQLVEYFFVELIELINNYAI